MSETGNTWTNGIVTPSDTTSYDTNKMRGLLVLTTGNVVLADAQGNVITLSNVPANSILPLKPKKISAATTAGIVILYL